MEFSKGTSSGSDSVASLALIFSMLKKLKAKGIISDDDIKEIKEWATEQIPSDNILKYIEAKELIDSN